MVHMDTVIRKWGNSAGVRLPAQVMKEAQIDIDQPVRVTARGRKIIIEPAGQYDLDTLLSGITERNLHTEADFGVPVGKETL